MTNWPTILRPGHKHRPGDIPDEETVNVGSYRVPKIHAHAWRIEKSGVRDANPASSKFAEVEDSSDDEMDTKEKVELPVSVSSGTIKMPLSTSKVSEEPVLPVAHLT